MVININKMSEGLDYELIPAKIENEQAWWVRILTGPFVETVISFGNVQINGKEEQLHFNFTIVESPDSSLNPDNVGFQNACGSILHDILDKAASREDLVLTNANESN